MFCTINNIVGLDTDSHHLHLIGIILVLWSRPFL